MERKTKTTIERGLLISGIAIAAFGLLTEGINYPWGTLVGKETIAADPAPVSEQWIEQSLPAEEDLVYLTDCDAYGTATAPEEALQVGVIKLPKLGTADNVVEGTELKDLALGAGHLAGSALPGASGNCVIAGDRSDDLMRHLELLGEGDTILLADQDTQYTYTVFQAVTVEPTEVWVTEPVERREAVLTLFTGTPSGSLKQRLVVQAELTASEPRS